MANALMAAAPSAVAALPSRTASFARAVASPSSSFVIGRSKGSTKLVSCRSKVGIRASGVDVSKIVPQADRILIRLESLAEQTSGGVLLPKSAVKYERYLVGEVLAMGSEVEKIDKGSRVLVSDINAFEVNLGTPEKLCFAKAEDLLAVVE